MKVTLWPTACDCPGIVTRDLSTGQLRCIHPQLRCIHLVMFVRKSRKRDLSSPQLRCIHLAMFVRKIAKNRDFDGLGPSHVTGPGRISPQLRCIHVGLSVHAPPPPLQADHVPTQAL